MTLTKNSQRRSHDFDRGHVLQGYTAAPFFWDLVSDDELPTMTTCLPDKLRSVQKRECLREERRAGVVCHQNCSKKKKHVRKQA